MAVKNIPLKKKLVIVESPTKARTIRKFLGKEFFVESCMGHIRDLPPSTKEIPAKYKKYEWAPLGVNVNKNFEPIYCISRDKEKVVKSLKSKLAEVDELYLATDEDREGESISWHLMEVLKPEVPVHRMIFNEITKKAIESSLKETRSVDLNLVKAQEARRILDRLVGYSISPLIWKKIAFGLSAGRVQSVAVRLISERELERGRFKKSNYLGVTAWMKKKTSGEGVDFESRLLSINQKKIAVGKDFDALTGKLLSSSHKEVLLLEEKGAHELLSLIKNKPWKVIQVIEKPIVRKPSAPFITSTLQQEANRKLGMSSRETMRTAQKLYEQGYITYMRTDSTFLSEEAIQAARQCINDKYDKEYLPSHPRLYEGKKVKGAQEAHEAIRPAGQSFISPDEAGLSGGEFKLYDLIWKRTVASQMVDARQKQVQVQLEVGPAVFVARGMTIEFPGFLRAYVEGSDDPEALLEEREVVLPPLKEGEIVHFNNAEITSHETKPPARFTEASLVQTMEKEGIGRPSTYASIIGTIIDRGYVRKQSNALIPTFTALVVSKLLKNFLPQYVDLNFTSEMENSLDKIAEGDLVSEKYLDQIYFGKEGLKKQIELQEKRIDAEEARSITLEGLEKFSFRVGKYGAYVCTKRSNEEVCASIPEEFSPSEITAESANKLIDQKINGADSIGKDPLTKLPVYVFNGRFGPYVQLGDWDENNEKKSKPKRMSIPKEISIENLTLNQALDLLSLPKSIGIHPQLKKEVKVGLGRFGPYLFCNGEYRSLPKSDDIFKVQLKRALEIFSQPKKGRGARSSVLKELGFFPETKDLIQVMNGPYGPYLRYGKKNISLPEGASPDSFTMEEAIKMIGSVSSKNQLKGSKKTKGKTEKGKTEKRKTDKGKFEEGKSGKGKSEEGKSGRGKSEKGVALKVSGRVPAKRKSGKVPDNGKSGTGTDQQVSGKVPIKGKSGKVAGKGKDKNGGHSSQVDVGETKLKVAIGRVGHI